MPRRRQLVLAAAFFVALPVACVTGGDTAGAGLVLAGGLVLHSAVASEAHSGKEGAALLWCRTLRRVDAALVQPGERAKATADFAESLLPDVNAYARQAGYSLHLLQLRELVTDVRRVALHPEAGAAERRRCPP